MSYLLRMTRLALLVLTKRRDLTHLLHSNENDTQDGKPVRPK